MRKDFTEELHMFPTLKDERRDATSDKKQEGGPPEQRWSGEHTWGTAAARGRALQEGTLMPEK